MSEGVYLAAEDSSVEDQLINQVIYYTRYLLYWMEQSSCEEGTVLETDKHENGCFTENSIVTIDKLMGFHSIQKLTDGNKEYLR